MEQSFIDLFSTELVECQRMIQTRFPFEEVIPKLESLLIALEENVYPINLPWRNRGLQLLNSAVQILTANESCVDYKFTGKIHIPVENIELMLSLKFKVVDIAKLYGVSRHTIARRLRESGLKARDTYAKISEAELCEKVSVILREFPNTGYKRMKGFLLSNGIKVTDSAVRNALRQSDPEGVYYRTMTNRAIVRRQYHVTYFNQLWHLDTNMKLIRWNLVIRACIDGKTRLVVYLDASCENSAVTNLSSFLKATSIYGVPYRTRSDKGGENVLIAQFMIQQRGVNRASHICGRSVHNQRIERYWRDVYYGYTSDVANILAVLEYRGILNIDNPKHMCLLHTIFLPRINASLQSFRNAWNHHPLSSETNRTPTQLMILSLPPESLDLQINEEDLNDCYFVCNSEQDAEELAGVEDTIVSPALIENPFSENELRMLQGLDLHRPSNEFGCDVFAEAISFLE